VFNPCTQKREHGAPVQGARLGGKRKAEHGMTTNTDRAKVVHFFFHSPSASRLRFHAALLPIDR
jgi:hypothetical protein